MLTIFSDYVEHEAISLCPALWIHFMFYIFFFFLFSQGETTLQSPGTDFTTFNKTSNDWLENLWAKIVARGNVWSFGKGGSLRVRRSTEGKTCSLDRERSQPIEECWSKWLEIETRSQSWARREKRQSSRIPQPGIPWVNIFITEPPFVMAGGLIEKLSEKLVVTFRLPMAHRSKVVFGEALQFLWGWDSYIMANIWPNYWQTQNHLAN